MGLREMQDMERILLTRTGCRKAYGSAVACPHCMAAQRAIADRMTQRPNQPRQDLGVVPYRRNPFAVLWDAALPWLQVAAVWASIVLVVCFSPQLMHRLDQWLGQ